LTLQAALLLCRDARSVRILLPQFAPVRSSDPLEAGQNTKEIPEHSKALANDRKVTY